MLDHTVLRTDLRDAHGVVLAPRGFALSAAAVEEAARRAVAAPRQLLGESVLAEDLALPLGDPAYRHLFPPAAAQEVRRAALAARLPRALLDELEALRTFDPIRYRHAWSTAAVTARLLLAGVGDSPAVAELAVAGLLHDLGMRHVPFHLVRNADELSRREVQVVAAHPLLGAYLIASSLGAHPAVEAALAHHWKNGQGYPVLARPPMRAVDVVAVASAFVALTQARPFRPEPFDARGAVDLLVAEANMGQRDPETLRLLVHALRGGRGELRDVRLAQPRRGHGPEVNHHTPIAPRVVAPAARG